MKTRIVIIAAYVVFIELAESIKYALNQFGINDVVIQDMDIQDGKSVEDFFKAEYDLTFMIKAFKRFSIYYAKGKKVLFQPEELWNRRQAHRYFGLMAEEYDRVLEMYDENVNLRGTQNVVYCPVGYSPVWESNLPEVKEDIDILFHGSMTDRRKEFYVMFKEMGLKIMFTGNAYGIERNKLIMRSKIDLNIRAHDQWSYGPMHCLPAQANKKFMLAEKGKGGYGPFKPGLHVAEYDGIKECKEKVLYWLEHEKERKEFAINAYEDMIKTCDFTETLRQALAHIPGKGGKIC